MRLGIIGRGYWGDVYARTLAGMGIAFWQAGRNWGDMPDVDGLIIASAEASHYSLAKEIIARNIPVLIEKPVCLNSQDVHRLLVMARNLEAIVFCGHTRLYSPAWRAFKQRLHGNVRNVFARYGKDRVKVSPWMDSGTHLVSLYLDMCDAGFRPQNVDIEATDCDTPLQFIVDGKEFSDVPTVPMPMQVMLDQFMAAIRCGYSDLHDLELALRIVAYVERNELAEARYGT